RPGSRAARRRTRTRSRRARARARRRRCASVAFLARVPVEQQRLELGQLAYRAELVVGLELREPRAIVLERLRVLADGRVRARRRMEQVRVLVRERLCAIGEPRRDVERLERACVLE